ncbi:hypothetical protein GGE67_002911 [Rhizobium leucaenae]|uniref:Uncharacterized protein n=1 Tax=Rhizobium leucaenae TaxID=29450 RepID=A0A7W6ZP37_9HYPH|nr:hypothetical protein [Rhizobium leucaenae]MBB6302292.1 hypothetical protein [Rhizobium leucaenae]
MMATCGFIDKTGLLLFPNARDDGGCVHPLLPHGEKVADRSDEGAEEHSDEHPAYMRSILDRPATPPQPALRATFSPLGRRETAEA